MIHSKQETSETTGPDHAGGLSGADRVAALPPLAVALGYLLTIILAELLTTLTEPRVGLALHSMILTVLVLHAALTWDRPIHTVLITLTFAPLIRLVSLSLPLFPFPLFTWYAIISLPLFVSAALTARLLGLRLDSLGINLRGLGWQLPIALTGFLFGYLEYQILRPQPLAESFTWQHLWMPALILLISTGFFEELVFRGLMQTTATQVFGRFGLPFVALVFAALHIGYKSVLDIAFVLSVGLFFGWAVAKTRSIVGVTLAHGLTNIVLFLVVPFVALAPPADLGPQSPKGSPAPVAIAARTATPALSPAATETGDSHAAPTAAATALPPPVAPSPNPRAAGAPLTPPASPTSVAVSPTSTRSPTPAASSPTPTRSLTSAAAASPTPIASLPWAVVKEDLLNVRTGPGRQYAVVRLAQPGQRCRISGRNSTGEWLLIEYADGLEGWVFSEYVKIEGDITSVPVEGETP